MASRSTKIWPYHPRILQDELLSSWIVRIAHGNHMKVQTYTQMLFGRERDLWVRDIDRLAPKWLTRTLAYRSGRSVPEVCKATLRAYRGLIYRSYRETGILHWIMPLHIYHRTRLGYGLQFCPLCLAEDERPYFRKRWRLAFYTFCTKHNVMMHECCPVCSAPVIFQRSEMGKYEISQMNPLSLCHQCGFDLSLSPIDKPVIYEQSGHQTLLGMLQLVEELPQSDRTYDLGFFNVAHQLCKIVSGKHSKLFPFLEGKVGMSSQLMKRGWMAIEERQLSERHEIIQLASWLIADPNRIISAWKEGAVRFNVLDKDFKRQPNWYKNILKRLRRAVVESQ